MVKTRGVFKTRSNFYDEVSFWKHLTAFNRSLFSQKNSIVNVRLSSKYASEYYNNFLWTFLLTILKLMTFWIVFNA